MSRPLLPVTLNDQHKMTAWHDIQELKTLDNKDEPNTGLEANRKLGMRA